ncbi:ATPase [Knoellia sinensis KCTC 19936]|uniref:ATPase n=1 Tax=Knoellia sinensis KCTC 19936 TaxID=1385520 RepID=A0A0A0J0G7_9MICO|nr:ATPase [Knoellia sinensis KCTC 19936]
MESRLRTSAAVLLLGPRQVGKTTLARHVVDELSSRATYLDLERPADQRRLADADAYLRARGPSLTVLDEVHRVPDLFAVLRGVIDENRRQGFRNGQFLLLGSASLDLMRLSSESLAGRVSHIDLAGVAVDEAASAGIEPETVWVRGGFPDSLTAPDDATSQTWREDLIRSYLERDIPMFAPRVPAESLRRLWTMLAHNSGGLLNASRLASGLGVSSPTVDRYVDLLSDLYLVRRLRPFHPNVGKRVTKSPKVHVRDSGLLHALLGLESLDDVLGHPSAGPSWESFVVEQVIMGAGPAYQPHHYRTATGDEVDLVLVRGGRPHVAIEVKRASDATVGAGFRRAIADLGVRNAFVVRPDVGGEAHTLGPGVTSIGVTELVSRLRGP